MAFVGMDEYIPSADSDASSDNDDKYEDREALTKCRQPLGLSINYVPNWKTRDAFREFFQNWKDAITETFDLKSRAFRLDITDDGDVYVAKAHHPDTGDLLGFVRYNGKDGTLELTNFKANLSRKSLELGVTSKRAKGHLAGTHGEGFKIAALVMVREGYQTRFETSSFYWRFTFAGHNKSLLYCNLTPVSQAKLLKQMSAYTLKIKQKTPRGLQNNIWEDVSIKIGRVHGPQWGKKISRGDFDKWVKVTIDLDCTMEIIKTPHGSLIFDERYSNKIFLKGLLLAGQSKGRKFKYGYDIQQGTVGRDRTSLEDSSEEHKILANIWREAIASQKKDALVKYVNMLWKQSEWADVNQAENQMSRTTVKAIWDHLHAQISGLNKFYHDDKHGDRDIQLIRRSLKREPVQLPACIWEPLRRFNHVRTPQEQRYHLLHSAPIATEKSTLYASMVKRALSAGLCLDKRTKRLELVFKDGAAAELDLLLDGTELMVNEKFLDFHASHKKVPCWLSLLSTTAGFINDTFSCDHVITDLYDMILMEVDKHHGDESDGPVEADGLLRLRLIENLRQMPRMVETTLGSNPGEIDVKWGGSEGDLVARSHGLDVKYRVTLHRESTCEMRRLDLVAPNGVSNDAAMSSDGTLYSTECGCPEQLVSQQHLKTTFRFLEYEESYFPMISGTHRQAFYGVRLPPKGIRPRGPEKPHFLESPSKFNSNFSRPGSSKPEEPLGDAEDLYDASSPEETGENIDQPSSPVSEIEVTPIRSRRAKSPHPGRASQGRSEKGSKNLRVKELQSQLEVAIKDLDSKDQQLQDAQASIAVLQSRLEAEALAKSEVEEKIANLTSKKHILEGKVEENRHQLEAQEQLLQQRTAESDTQRVARQAADQQLRDANTKNRALKDRLEDVQHDLAQALNISSNLATRLNASDTGAKRERIEEDGSSAPSPRRDQKRARKRSPHTPASNLAEDPIQID